MVILACMTEFSLCSLSLCIFLFCGAYVFCALSCSLSLFSHTYIHTHTFLHTAAPWSRYTHDVARWLLAEKEEYALKLKYLKKTNHGLMRKDLMVIKARMEVCVCVCVCVCEIDIVRRTPKRVY